MKENTNINEGRIVEEYINTKIGIEKLALKYHIGKIRIKKILDEYGIEYKKRGGQPNNGTFIVNDIKIKKYINGKDFHYIVTDIKSGWESTDIYNKSGKLTQYIRNKYNVDIPSLYERNKYYKLTGNYWWEQYLEYKKMPSAEVKKCPYCDWETVDVNNRSGMFETHLKKVHNISKFDYLKEFPNDKQYFNGASQILNLQLESDTNKFVTCKICGKKLTKICNSHLKTHGITKEEYIEKYGDSDLMCNETYTKFNGLAHNMNVSLTNNMERRFTSKAETEIIEYIRSFGIECGKNRSILNGKELDVFIPSKNIAIEYNGNIWHSENFGGKDKGYHISKLNECNKRGIELIQIFDDEYINHKELCLNKISDLLGLNQNKFTVEENECNIQYITYNEYVEYIKQNSIYPPNKKPNKCLGYFTNNTLIGTIGFSKTNKYNNEWIITDMCTNHNFNNDEIHKAILAYFIKHNKVNSIMVFADRRWTININNNVYTQIGFTLCDILPPRYYFYNKNENSRIFPIIQKDIDKYNKLGYDKIWDCGLIKYIYKNEK